MWKGLYTLGLLTVSNLFMNLAWYGHLQFEKWGWQKQSSMVSAIFISWFIALAEYSFQVPANKIGFKGNGGPFYLVELKTLQECLSLGVFVVLNTLIFKEKISLQQLIGFGFLMIGAFLIIKK